MLVLPKPHEKLSENTSAFTKACLLKDGAFDPSIQLIARDGFELAPMPTTDVSIKALSLASIAMNAETLVTAAEIRIVLNPRPGEDPCSITNPLEHPHRGDYLLTSMFFRYKRKVFEYTGLTAIEQDVDGTVVGFGTPEHGMPPVLSEVTDLHREAHWAASVILPRPRPRKDRDQARDSLLQIKRGIQAQQTLTGGGQVVPFPESSTRQ